MQTRPLNRSPVIETAVLRSGGAEVHILSLGAITQDWQVAVSGRMRPMVLGYRDPKAYLTNPCHLGVIAGRVANRIGQARFSLGGQSYQLERNAPPHCLHGGAVGLGRRHWALQRDGDRAVRLTYHSPDGEDGFPGAVDFSVTIRLAGATLTYDMQALPDRPTPINLAQHSYYSLGADGIDGFALQIPADRYTPTDATDLPTGEILPLAGTPLDFRARQAISQTTLTAGGIDQNLILPPGSKRITLAAGNGIRLAMQTDQPGLQVYTAQHLKPGAAPLAGQAHRRLGAICLESQNFPDAINQPGFPNSVFTPETPYRQTLSVAIEAVA